MPQRFVPFWSGPERKGSFSKLSSIRGISEHKARTVRIRGKNKSQCTPPVPHRTDEPPVQSLNERNDELRDLRFYDLLFTLLRVTIYVFTFYKLRVWFRHFLCFRKIMICSNRTVESAHRFTGICLYVVVSSQQELMSVRQGGKAAPRE